MVQRNDLRQMRLIRKRRAGGLLAGHADVEGRTQPIHESNEFAGTDPIPYPKSGQSIRLGERAQHNQALSEMPELETIRVVGLIRKLEVGLVHHNDDFLRHAPQKLLDSFLRNVSPRRVVGVVDDHDASVTLHRLRHERELMHQVPVCRNCGAAHVVRCCDNRIHAKSRTTEDHVMLGRHECAHDELDEFIGAIAVNDLGQGHLMGLSDGAPQAMAGAVGVPVHMSQSGSRGRNGGRTRTQSALIAGELDDVGKAALTGELFDRFTALVGHERGNTLSHRGLHDAASLHGLHRLGRHKHLDRILGAITVRPMMRTSLFASALLLLPLLGGCDEKPAADTTPSTGESAAKTDKQQQVEALLRQNGIDPATIDGGTQQPPVTGAPPTPPSTTAPTNADGTLSSAPGGAGEIPLPFTVTLLGSGAQPHKALSYRFSKGAVLKFSADMAVDTTRTVDGQPDPSVPAVKLSMAGTTETVELNQNTATLRSTFANITPSAEGVPEFMKEQMLAEYAQLSGIQLIGAVQSNGQVMGMEVVQGALMNPQVVALMQNLQDTLAKGFLPLPTEPVGVGAKWKAETSIQGQGLSGKETTEITLTAVRGDKLSLLLNFSQSADPQRIDAAGLPPGAQVELLEMSGQGKGSMSVDLVTLETESKLDISMKLDTRVSGVGTPAPVQSLTKADMKIHLKMSK